MNQFEEHANRKLPTLAELYRWYGDFKVTMQNRKGRWKRWKMYSECSQNELEESNLRQIMIDEIVLDCDHVDPKEVRAKLIDQGYTFDMYLHRYIKNFAPVFCKNHIHLIFQELRDKPFEQRKAIRKAFIRQFKCDEQKASDKTLIAMPYAKHPKTGMIKILVDRYGK